MRNLNRKINSLEESILQEPVVGSTKICTCAFPEPEQVLLEKARRIAEMGISYEAADERQRAIMQKAAYILRFRVYDLFTMYLDEWCHDDKIARTSLHERFLWFIQELRKEVKQNLEVAEIEKNAPKDCEVDKVDEYFRKAPKCFTEDSYYKLLEDLTQAWVKEMKKTGKWKDLMKKVKQNG